jgi:hypothetical protein
VHVHICVAGKRKDGKADVVKSAHLGTWGDGHRGILCTIPAVFL